MTNLDSILKSRDITFLTKVHLVKAMVFPVVMYRCDSWTIKKAEHWRIDIFKLWWWRRLLAVPWTARRSNQFILKEINPEYSLEGLMLKLKLQYFGHLMWRSDSLEKTLMLGKMKAEGEGDSRGWDGWMASLTQWRWVWVSFGSWWWTERPDVLQSMGSQIVVHEWVTELTERQTKYSFMDEWSEVKWNSFSLVWLFVMPWTSPWISLGQNTGVHSLSLLQWIFPTQGLNPVLLHCRWILYCLRHQGSPNQLTIRQLSKKRNSLGTSLMVQWLRIHLAIQGTRVWSLVWELRSHMSQGD